MCVNQITQAENMGTKIDLVVFIIFSKQIFMYGMIQFSNHAWHKQIKAISIIFYLPHMEYEGSIGLVMRKMKFFFADFHFLGPFMNK
jgi:hypothetical protein